MRGDDAGQSVLGEEDKGKKGAGRVQNIERREGEEEATTEARQGRD